MRFRIREKNYTFILIGLLVFGLVFINQLAQNDKSDVFVSYLAKYPFYLRCQSRLPGWERTLTESEIQQGFLLRKPAELEHHYLTRPSSEKRDERITRAVILYFPLERSTNFETEFKWLFASWAEMLKHEPAKWRTDLIVFTDAESRDFGASAEFLTKLNCSVKNRRQSVFDEPMCSIVAFKPFESRRITSFNIFENNQRKYEFQMMDVDIFSDDPANILPLYAFLKDCEKYEFLNSILVAFEGYEYFKLAGYDFLVRSDMDILLTPLFGEW